MRTDPLSMFARSAVLLLLLVPIRSTASQHQTGDFTVFPSVLSIAGGELCDSLQYDVMFTLGGTGVGHSANEDYSLWSGFRPRIRLTVICASVAGVDSPGQPASERTTSFAISPNPASGAVRVTCAAEPLATLRVVVCDPAGRHICNLTSEPTGRVHELTWDGCDAHGHPVAAGSYFLLCRAGSEKDTRKVVVLR